jgi:hypothetical protein
MIQHRQPAMNQDEQAACSSALLGGVTRPRLGRTLPQEVLLSRSAPPNPTASTLPRLTGASSPVVLRVLSLGGLAALTRRPTLPDRFAADDDT